MPLAAPAASSSFSMSLTMNSGSPVAFSKPSRCLRTSFSFSTTVGSHTPGAFGSGGAAGVAGAAGAAGGAGAAAAAASILSSEAEAIWYFAFQSLGKRRKGVELADEAGHRCAHVALQSGRRRQLDHLGQRCLRCREGLS